jgi:hypothetical protein
MMSEYIVYVIYTHTYIYNMYNRTELREGVMQWVGLVDASAVLEEIHILLQTQRHITHSDMRKSMLSWGHNTNHTQRSIPHTITCFNLEPSIWAYRHRIDWQTTNASAYHEGRLEDNLDRAAIHRKRKYIHRHIVKAVGQRGVGMLCSKETFRHTSTQDHHSRVMSGARQIHLYIWPNFLYDVSRCLHESDEWVHGDVLPARLLPHHRHQTLPHRHTDTVTFPKQIKQRSGYNVYRWVGIGYMYTIESKSNKYIYICISISANYFFNYIYQ